MIHLAPGDPLIVDGRPVTFVAHVDDDEPHMVYRDEAGVDRWMFARSWRLRARAASNSPPLVPIIVNIDVDAMAESDKVRLQLEQRT